ncbi:MAG: hypothetical protein GYA51_03460 [Candidatus Methanofastidiosa archaeon]|jgi:hypothetical protein|nr:hypothetical protein [Candidatus Methanofastidiosa archaeon]
MPDLIDTQNHYYYDKNNTKDMEDAVKTIMDLVNKGDDFQVIEIELNGINKKIRYCEITVFDHD